VPPQVIIAPLFSEMVSMRLVDTYWGVILPQVAQPAMVYILYKFFQGVPRELEEAAFVDGAGSGGLLHHRAAAVAAGPRAVSIFVFIAPGTTSCGPSSSRPTPTR